METKLSKGWKRIELNEFLIFEYGKGLPKNSRIPGNVPVYGSSGVLGYHNQPYVNGKGVIIGRKGQVGIVHYSKAPFWPIDTVFFIRESDNYDIRFVYYLLKSVNLPRLTGDSAVPGLKRDIAYYEEVTIPTLVLEQQKIAEILGSLDDKIELDYEMNKTLEAVAQVIFKSWFINFEPFKDELSYNNELNTKLPKGWEVTNYSSIADYTFGYPFESSYFNEKRTGFPIIRIRDLPDDKAEIYTTEKFKRIYVVKPGDILVSMDGEFKAYIWKGREVLLNQRIVKITPKENEMPRSYLYYSVKKPLSIIEASKVGTTVIHLNKEDLDEIKVILPRKDALKKFAKIAEHLIDLQVFNVQEIYILEHIRDALLPKLLSGEIRVKVDFEKEFPEEVKELEKIGDEKAKIQKTLSEWG